MKKKFMAFLAVMVLLINTSWGQGINNLYIETGFDGLGCAAPDKEYIRAVNSTQWDGFYSQSILALAGLPHFGLKYEKMISGNLLGLSAGVRYSQLLGIVGREVFFTGSDMFFYVNYREDGQITEYARVKELRQRTGYIGVPIELRLTPGRDRVIKFYCRAGLSFNMKLHSESDVIFFDDNMNVYKDDVAAVIEDPSPFYASIYMGGGLKIGRNDRPGVMIGFNMLTAVITSHGTGLVKPYAGAGGQIMARIPLNYPEQ